MDEKVAIPDVKAVFRGELDDIPAQESQVVRIFLSSTFTDYSEERNLLFREAIPELRSYCQKKGLDFQVSDMRWGVRDDATTDHQTVKLCLDEIANCQKVSKGPNFVAFLGNRYGTRSYPSIIEAGEFKTLLRAARTVSKDTALMEKWYKRDDNVVPPAYILLPITTYFPHYNDEVGENQDLAEKERSQWNAVNELLQNIFRAAAVCAFKYGEFSHEQKERYFISVTAREVQKGILRAERPSQTTLCFERDLINIDLQDKKARRFVDLDAGLIDTEAQELLEDLREIQVPRSLPHENIETKTVCWAEGGVSSSNIEHVKYLEEFKDDFVAKVGELIYKSVQEQQTINTNMVLYKEVLFHSHFCEEKTEHFCGRDETFNRIKFKLNKIYYKEELLQGGKKDSKYRHMMDKYLDNLPKQTEDLEEEEEDEHEKHLSQLKDSLKDAGIPVAHELELGNMSLGEESMKLLDCMSLGQYTKPVVLYGASGTGKSSMMAMIARLCHKWLEYRPVKVIRFLGMSSQSKSIRAVLRSICEQIWQNYEGTAPPTMVDISENFAYLVQYFKALLHTLDTSEKPLLIILDSVDQLTTDDNAHNMQWLPILLPANVHIVVSMLPEEHGILQATKVRLRDDDRYVEVPPLPKDTANNILTMWLAKCNRTLTKEQRDVLLAKLRMCPQPLFLKLTFEQAKEWHSYTPRDQLTLGITTRSLIEQYFIKLEKDHGKILTSKALGYMTVARAGLTEIEMEDILSLDDEVLQDSYIYHLPPDPQTIRLPPLLWVRLKTDTSEYLVEQQQSDGKKIVHWFHRQFREAAEKRYAGKDVAALYHSNLVDYFAGKWNNVVKPLELTKKKVGSYPDCVRGVPAQHITHGNGVYNLRKMTELPLHLLKSKRYEDFLSEICYNFEWLYYKCKATTISEVKRDLRMAMYCINEEIDALKQQQEEDRKRKERDRKRLKGKVPNMEVGTSQVKIVEVAGSPSGTVNEDVDGSVQKQNTSSYHPEGEEMVNGPENTADDEQEQEVDPDLLQEGDIFKLTSQMVRSLSELEQLFADIETVHDLLGMATSAISKDANNLIMQILGTLSEDASLPEGLSHLRSQASTFVEETNMPLLYPKTKCLPSAGGELKTSIDISLGFTGDAFDQENKISLSKDGRYLYIVERSKTDVKDLKKGQGGDFLYTFDLARGGDQLSLERMNGQDIKWMELVGGDKYMYLQVYTQRDKHRPKYMTVINHMIKQMALPFTPDTQIVDFSKTGKFCLIVEPHYRRGENEIATQTDTSILPSIEVAAIIDLETQQRTSLKVILGEGETEVSDTDLTNMQIMHGVFSEDEKFVVLAATSGKVYCFLTERGKFMYKWESGDSTRMMVSEDKERLKRAMTILPNNYLLMPGLTYKSASSLFMRNLNNGETIKELEGMKYSIGLTEVNKKNTLIATATKESAIINGDKDKDILVWNIERGELFSRCCNKSPVAALYFIGKDEEYLLSSSQGVKVVKVWYIGTQRKPCANAMPIHNIIGHSDRVLNIAVSHQHNMLVTASADNTVKLWSLEKIVDKCDEMLALSHSMGMEGLRDQLMREPRDRPKEPSQTASCTMACVVTKDSKHVVCGTDEGWVLFIDLESQCYTSCHKLEGEPITHIVATSDQRHVVTAGQKQDIIVWDPKTGYVVRKITPVRPVYCMVENNNVLVTGKGGMECYGVLYNLQTGAVIRELQGLYGFSKVCITSDATKVVSTFFEYPMIYSVETGQPHMSGKPDCMMAGCTCLQLSPCDRLVASGSTDGSVRVMDMSTGKYKFRMQHTSSVVSSEFSTDSASLVTAGFRNILVWSMKTGGLMHSLIRHQDFITDLQFACGGRFLISSSNDKQIIIWDYKNNKSVAAFHAHCPIRSVHITKDLSSVVFAPENVHYVALLKPNRVLQEVLKGEEKNQVPEPMVQAQAFALSFSSQRAKVKSSTACTLL